MDQKTKKHRTRAAVTDPAGGVGAAPDHFLSPDLRSPGVTALRRRFGFK
ncbi:MAG: hypothetical protein LUD76_10620 [Alistipes sp.]|nr:hypothetical protein [Alistipes sp.]